MTTCGDCEHQGDCFMDGWEVSDNNPSCDGFKPPSTPEPVFPNYDYDELSDDSKRIVNELVMTLKETEK